MSTALWDWRRRIADLYAAVRADPDREQAWARWRHEREALFAAHPESPLGPEARPGFTLPCFAYDPAWRLIAGLVATEAPMRSVPAGADGVVQLRPFAHTDGLATTLGRELTLFWIEGYGGGVFLPFADATSGQETYGGGRYLLDTIKGADLGATTDGQTVFDFNFAYAPSCAWSPRWVCPLAPAENRLAVPIRAGERVAQRATR